MEVSCENGIHSKVIIKCMRIDFNASLKIGGIGIVPWPRLGPERWLPNYRIASLYDWDVDMTSGPRVYSLMRAGARPGFAKNNTPSLLKDKGFQAMLKTHFSDYKMMTYKPVDTSRLSLDVPIKFLSGNEVVAKRFENKAFFRERMSSLDVTFPSYRIIETAYLLENMSQELASGLGKPFVLQDVELSGGKGTFIVRDTASLRKAHTALRAGKSSQVVLSEYIDEFRERTLQGVVTGHGIFVGPLQKQIVRDPVLANLDSVEGDKFCGVEIGFADSCKFAYPEMKRLTQVIGNELQRDGYRGIFGVDFLVGKDSNVYVIEVNPRITGATPLLTALYDEGDIPFYLLHILELAGETYGVSNLHTQGISGSGSLLVIHAQNNETARIVRTMSSGVYNKNLQYVAPSVSFCDIRSDQIILQQYAAPMHDLKPGGRIFYMYLKEPALDMHDNLRAEVAQLVQAVQAKLLLQEKNNV